MTHPTTPNTIPAFGRYTAHDGRRLWFARAAGRFGYGESPAAAELAWSTHVRGVMRLKNGRMQCKHVPEMPLLAFIAAARVAGLWVSSYELDDAVHASHHSVPLMRACPARTPWKVMLRKADKLIRRGWVDGCACGCSGQFTLTDAGCAELHAWRVARESLALQQRARPWQVIVDQPTIADDAPAIMGRTC